MIISQVSGIKFYKEIIQRNFFQLEKAAELVSKKKKTERKGKALYRIL